MAEDVEMMSQGADKDAIILIISYCQQVCTHPLVAMDVHAVDRAENDWGPEESTLNTQSVVAYLIIGHIL